MESSLSPFFIELRRRYADKDRFLKVTRDRMALHGISQSALAKRAGIAPPNVSAWMGISPKHKPNMETMVLLDIALEQLIEGK